MGITLTEAHPRQRENALRWLKKIRSDIDEEIRSIEADIRAEKESRRARDAFNGLMRDLISENCTDAEAEKRLVQRGYPAGSISDAKKLLKTSAAHRRRAMRDAEIMRRVLVSGDKPTHLAREYGISRKQVHLILKKADPMDKKKDAVFTPRPVLGET